MPDVNVWLALSWRRHTHFDLALQWWNSLDGEDVYFCRFTQLGLMRLLMTQSLMGENCLTAGEAWSLYAQWLEDTRVQFRIDSPRVDEILPQFMLQVGKKPSPKALGDYYLVAMATALGAALVTMDTGIARLPGAEIGRVLTL